MMNSIAKVEVTIDQIRIDIDDTLHLLLGRRDIIGIQSYVDGHALYVIEYYTSRGQTIKTEYQWRHVWSSILRQLGEYKSLFRT